MAISNFEITWKCDLCEATSIEPSDVHMPKGWERVTLGKTGKGKFRVSVRDAKFFSDEIFDLCDKCYPGEEVFRKMPGTWQDSKKKAKLVTLVRLFSFIRRKRAKK